MDDLRCASCRYMTIRKTDDRFDRYMFYCSLNFHETELIKFCREFKGYTFMENVMFRVKVITLFLSPLNVLRYEIPGLYEDAKRNTFLRKVFTQYASAKRVDAEKRSKKR